MTSNSPKGSDRSKSKKIPTPPSAEGVQATTLHVARSGDWLPVEEFQEIALAAAREGGDVVLNLEGVDHLDASAFQIVLALSAEQEKRGKALRLENASSNLKQAFKHAGANQYISGNVSAEQ